MASELKLDVVEMNKNNIKLLHIPAKDAKTYNIRLSDAFNYTLSKRPQVRPNSNFRRQLEIYEQELIYNRYKISIRAKTLGFATPIPAAPKSATNNPTYRF